MKKLICHTDLIMEPAACTGQTYEIIGEDERGFEIINEQGEPHGLSKNPSSDSYYGHWFNIEE